MRPLKPDMKPGSFLNVLGFAAPSPRLTNRLLLPLLILLALLLFRLLYLLTLIRTAAEVFVHLKFEQV